VKYPGCTRLITITALKKYLRRRIKMAPIQQKLVTTLWFEKDVEEAVKLYVTTFKNSKQGDITRATKVGFETTGIPEGAIVTIEFALEGQKFIAINGGPVFKFNPSISFLVACTSKEEVNSLWKKLSPGGTALMELGKYPFSERYGWMQDKNGLSWQIMLMGADMSFRQKITPTLMYTGKVSGKAEDAVKFYASVFHNSRVGGITRYAKGEEPDIPGTVKHAAFTLEGEDFAAMDSALNHGFNFNEAISIMVVCATQTEIDYYWNKLTAGGEESVCGWLKDKYGVSWQVTPEILQSMLKDPDINKVERVTKAFLKMKKLVIADLEKAYAGK
jgi:predicted 3-demethylubiquinone-9 3-methyltransferase (glyoxalase superfamily)